jgi:hypothetical protein
MKLKAVERKSDIRIADEDARIDTGMDEQACEDEMQKHSHRISELQRVLYADARYALLIVLQGRDAAGKDGTIRKVFSVVNPQGCSVSRFAAPSEVEKQHDYLWRVHQQVPARGMIGIFNRSHYEDVLVPRVHGTVPKKEIAARYDQINDFEAMLAANGVVILKFFLHRSGEELEVPGGRPRRSGSLGRLRRCLSQGDHKDQHRRRAMVHCAGGRQGRAQPADRAHDCRLPAEAPPAVPEGAGVRGRARDRLTR